MKEIHIEAREVRTGDRVYNNRAEHPAFRWSGVTEAEEVDWKWTLEGGKEIPGKAIRIDAGYMMYLHPREGIIVQRRET